MKFTSVSSLHTNPNTCGVAKFSQQLAQRLGVQFRPLYDDLGEHPLLSLKAAEFRGCNMGNLDTVVEEGPFSVFWHDAGLESITRRATHVFYADPSLGSPGLFCPSLLTPSKPRTVRLFSFGMAHKLQTQHYAKVRQLLEDAGLDYRLRVSVGLHEGTSLDDATKHFDALKEIMGADKVTILGCLSDDAVAEELHNADTVLAFFERGVRANNTTVHAALDHGCRVITNSDFRSPSQFVQTTLSIDHIFSWPKSAPYGYSWGHLIAEMEAICARSQSAAV